MLNFDTTIHLSDLVMWGGGLLAFFKVFLSVRDAMRDLTRAVGTASPPSGLRGEMQEVKGEVRQHHTWLVRAGLDQARVVSRDEGTP